MSKKIIIYQVLPRLFGNIKGKNKFNGDKKTNGCGKFNDFTEKTLQEIKKLGVSHIWYTGVIEHATQTDYTKYGIKKDNSNIVKGKAGSPYAIKDYYDVDPDLATNINNRIFEFKDLIKRTHNAGLKVIIDFVGNHVARQYSSDAKPDGENDLGENDNTNLHFSNNNNFYYVPNQTFKPKIDIIDNKEPYIENPAKATGNDFFGIDPSAYDWYETIKLNYGIDYLNNHTCHFEPIPNTWYKMLNILSYWAKFDIDGFRCDMAEMIPIEFWKWAIPQIKKINSNIIFIAETYNPNQYEDYLNIAQFDYLYDKVGLYDTLKNIICNRANTCEIHNAWQRIDRIKNKMLNFLENHDEQRIASDFFAVDPTKARPAMIVSATISNGPVMIYSGQEFGEKGMNEEGFSRKDGRTTIFDYWSVDTIKRWINNWKFDKKDLTKEENDLYQFYSKLLNICLKEKALSEGDFFDLMYVNYDNQDFNSNRCYAYLRKYKNDLLLIVVNFDENEQHLKINIPEHAFNFLNIKSGEKRKITELFSQEKSEQILASETKFETSVKAQNGVIYKIKL